MKTLLTCLSLFCLSMLVLADDPKPNLDGSWELTKGVMAGNDLPEELLKSIKLTIKGNEYEVTVGDQRIKGTSTSDDSTTPKRMKLKDKDGPNADKTIYAIYELNKDEMKVCYAMEGTEYPKEFKSPADSKLLLAVYKRAK
jgi:uncharacterized protein (TIGR03067 family)